MADNVVSNAGSGGVTWAADDISSVYYARQKLVHGADGTNDGDVSTANPLPIRLYVGTTTTNLGAGTADGGLRVTLASDDPAVTDLAAMEVLLGTIDADTGGILTAIQLIDDAVYTDGTGTPSKGLAVMGTDGTNPQLLSVNSSGHLNIADGGNTITVDGTVAVSGTVTVDLGANNDVTLATLPDTSAGDLAAIRASVGGTLTVGSHAVTNAGVFAVQVDGAALTALQIIDNPVFADDAAFTLASSSVMMAGAIRDDTLSTLTAIEGDAVPLRVSSTGALHVTGAGGGTQYNVDDAAGATDTGTLLLAIRDDSLATLTPADGDYVGLRVSSTGALHVTGGGGGTEYNEDAATPATITGTATMMERDDALSALTPIEGDWASMRCDANGALWVAVNSSALPSGASTSANQTTIIGHLDGVEGLLTTIDTDTGNIATAVQIMDDWDNGASDGCSVSGDVAHDTADAGEPVKLGARAETSLAGITLVADADRTNLYADADGVLVTKLGTTGADFLSEAVSNTDGTSTALTTFGATASAYNYITAYSVFRTDAGTSMAYVDFRDGTAGSVLWRVPLPPNGGANLSLGGLPIFKTGANTALAIDVSSALSTVYISVSGYKSKV